MVCGGRTGLSFGREGFSGSSGRLCFILKGFWEIIQDSDSGRMTRLSGLSKEEVLRELELWAEERVRRGEEDGED